MHDRVSHHAPRTTAPAAALDAAAPARAPQRRDRDRDAIAAPDLAATGTAEPAAFGDAVNAGIHPSLLSRAAEGAPAPAAAPVRHTDSIEMARELRERLEARLHQMEAAGSRPEAERVGPTRVAEARDPVHLLNLQLETAALRVQIDQLRAVRNDDHGAAVVDHVARTTHVEVEHHTFETGPQVASSAHREGAARVRETSVTQHDLDGTEREGRLTTTDGLADGQLGRTRAFEARTTAADGSSRRREEEHHTGVGIADGGIEATRSHGATDTVHNADGSGSVHADETESSASINREHATGSRSHVTRDETTDAAGNTTALSRTTEGHGGAVFGEGGNGIALGGSRAGTSSRGVTTDGEAETRESREHRVGGEGTVTDRGGTLGGTGSGAVTSGPVSARGNIGIGGGYTVDIERVEGSTPPRFQLVTRIEVHASGGGSAGATRGDNAISGGVDANASHTTTFRHEMTQAEADRYIVNARHAAAGGTASDEPEFRFMARIRAARSGTDPARSALSDPADAGSMAAGSSVETTDVVGASVHGSASLGVAGTGAGVAGSGGRTTTRTIRVSHTNENGENRIAIHLEFSDEHTSALSANARLEGVAAQVGTTATNSEGRKITVALDPASPTYAADYHAVMGAQSRAEAEALAVRLHGSFSRQSHTANGTNVDVGIAGDGGAPTTGLGRRDVSDEGSDVSVENGHVSGTTTGQHSSALTGRAGSTAVVEDTESTTATARLSHGRQTVDVEQSHADSLPVVPGQAWVDRNIAAAERDRGDGAQGVRERLLRALQTSRRELDSIRFNDGDVVALAGRAANAEAWLGALDGGVIGHVRKEWNRLGDGLRAPVPDPDLDRIEHEGAVKIARGHAITHFIAVAESPWGQRAIEQAASGGNGAAALGRHTQWPDDIADRAAPFHALETQVREAPEHYRAITGANRENQIRAYSAHIDFELGGILAAVRGCTTFSDSTTKVTTMTMVQNLIISNTHATRDALAPAHAGGEAAAAEGAADAEVAPDVHERQARALAEVRTYKSEEHRHWEAAQSQIGRAHGWFASASQCYIAAVTELEAVAATYPAWLAALHEADAAVRAASGNLAELDHLRPNPHWSIELFHQAQAIDNTVAGFGNDNRLPAEWLAAANPPADR